MEAINQRRLFVLQVTFSLFVRTSAYAFKAARLAASRLDFF
jgi:hypothetical protein